MSKKTFTFQSCDNNKTIWADEYIPESSPIGVLQLSHGVIEHIGRYEPFANYMCSKGFVVVGEDHLGHGRTGKEANSLGFFSKKNGWNNVIDDMHTLYEFEHNKYPDLPYFLLGHSMGSFLSRNFAIKYPDISLDGLILSGTGQEAHIVTLFGNFLFTFFQLFVGKTYQGVAPNVLVFGTYYNKIPNPQHKSDWLTRDSELAAKYDEDKDSKFLPSLGLLNDMLRGIRYIGHKYNIKKMDKNLRVLFFSGDMDPVGHYGKSATKVYNMFKGCGLKDVTLTLYADNRHECLSELNKDDVYTDVLNWIMKGISKK